MSSYDEHLISMAGGDGEPEPLDQIAAKSWDAIIDGAAPWAEQDEETIRIHTETVRAVLGAVQFCWLRYKTEQEAPQASIQEPTP